MKNKKIWYRLDAFARTYSSIISEGRTTCFRLSALLYNEVDLDILKETALYMQIKYPFYNSELKKGIFWNYLQHKGSPFEVDLENTYPCTEIKKKNPLRIIYYKNKISIEIAHFLTDGAGAMAFFKDMVERYIELRYLNGHGNGIGEEAGIARSLHGGNILPDDHVSDDGRKREVKYIDLYTEHMRKVNKEMTLKKAFHLPLKILEKGQYYVTTGEIPLDALKGESRKYNTTVGRYLLAVYFKILLDKYPHSRKEIVIGVPVDLRKVFMEETYRNFFINIAPSLDPSLGSYTLEEIIGYLDSYFRIKINRKEFHKSIYKAVNPSRNIIIKAVPYIIKRLFFPFIFDYYGERGYTTGFSNLGVFRLEKKYESFIRGIRFIPPPSKRCKVKIGVIGNGDKVNVTFGNLTANHEVERDFFIYLRKIGIRSRIITNY